MKSLQLAYLSLPKITITVYEGIHSMPNSVNKRIRHHLCMLKLSILVKMEKFQEAIDLLDNNINSMIFLGEYPMIRQFLMRQNNNPIQETLVECFKLVNKTPTDLLAYRTLVNLAFKDKTECLNYEIILDKHLYNKEINKLSIDIFIDEAIKTNSILGSILDFLHLIAENHPRESQLSLLELIGRFESTNKTNVWLMDQIVQYYESNCHKSCCYFDLAPHMRRLTKENRLELKSRIDQMNCLKGDYYTVNYARLVNGLSLVSSNYDELTYEWSKLHWKTVDMNNELLWFQTDELIGHISNMCMKTVSETAVSETEQMSDLIFCALLLEQGLESSPQYYPFLILLHKIYGYFGTGDELTVTANKLKLKNIQWVSNCEIEFCNLARSLQWQSLIDLSKEKDSFMETSRNEFMQGLRESYSNCQFSRASEIVVSTRAICECYLEPLLIECVYAELLLTPFLKHTRIFEAKLHLLEGAYSEDITQDRWLEIKDFNVLDVFKTLTTSETESVTDEIKSVTDKTESVTDETLCDDIYFVMSPDVLINRNLKKQKKRDELFENHSVIDFEVDKSFLKLKILHIFMYKNVADNSYCDHDLLEKHFNLLSDLNNGGDELNSISEHSNYFSTTRAGGFGLLAQTDDKSYCKLKRFALLESISIHTAHLALFDIQMLNQNPTNSATSIKLFSTSVLESQKYMMKLLDIEPSVIEDEECNITDDFLKCFHPRGVGFAVMKLWLTGSRLHLPVIVAKISKLINKNKKFKDQATLQIFKKLLKILKHFGNILTIVCERLKDDEFEFEESLPPQKMRLLHEKSEVLLSEIILKMKRSIQRQKSTLSDAVESFVNQSLI
eukprot:GHVL01011703.1.p1 GENE.GHVL01011703.1~~GHVL01011703.1.p1  ORF type:complete len:843 (-),score=176.00 GHVL01011703.1:1141-3669(-)